MVGEGDAKGRMKRHFSLIVFEKRQVKLLTVYHCAFFFLLCICTCTKHIRGNTQLSLHHFSFCSTQYILVLQLA